MSARADAVENYTRRGWITFVYDSLFTPGTDWQHSRNDGTALLAAEHTDNPIAVLLGKDSDLVVIDVDPQNGGDVTALFERYGEDAVTQTRVVQTASGGFHVYYRYPDGVDSLKGVIDMGKHVAELRGIDFLGDNRHVIAPPTARVGHPKKPDGTYTVRVDRTWHRRSPMVTSESA